MKKLFLFTISIVLLVGCQENEINETETDNGQSVTLKTSAYFISEK